MEKKISLYTLTGKRPFQSSDRLRVKKRGLVWKDQNEITGRNGKFHHFNRKTRTNQAKDDNNSLSGNESISDVYEDASESVEVSNVQQADVSVSTQISTTIKSYTKLNDEFSARG